MDTKVDTSASSHSCSIEATAAFQSILPILTKEFENIPEDGAMMLEKLIQRLTNAFQSPPQQDFEFFIGKRFADDEIRILLFQPLPEQVQYYAKGLIAGLHVPKDHPVKKTSSLLLTLTYLIHRKNLDFMKEFILSDGLEALIEYLDVENLYERSQAMETFMAFTDCDFFDWFASPSSYQSQQMHQRLIAILSSGSEKNKNQNYFIEKLVKNRDASYPGGSLRALQLLAFWLSWIRALYTQDQRLVLSKQLLDEIRLWSLPFSSLSSISDINAEDERSEDERKLAETLYEDFGQKQFENISDVPKSETEGFSILGVKSPQFVDDVPKIDTLNIASGDDLKTRNTAIEAINSPTYEVTPTIEVATKYKSEGNEHYKTAKYDLALSSYHYAMNTVQRILTRGIESVTKLNGCEEEDIDTLKITLHTNIANTIWKLWTEGEGDEESSSYFNDIKQHCEAVLELSPYHVKALYRLANAYIKNLELKKAYSITVEFLQKLSAKASSSSTEDAKLFERLKRKCIALQLHEVSLHEGALFAYEDWNLSIIDLIFLKSLMKRLQVSERVIAALQRSLDKLPAPSKKPIAKKVADDPEDSENQLFTTNQDLLQEIPKKHESISLKVQTKSQVKLMKMKQSDRKLVTQLKAIGKSIKTGYDNKALLSDLEPFVKSGFQIVKELWDHELKLKDIYGSLIDENDLLYLLSLISIALSPPPLTNTGAIVSTSLSYKEWIAGSEVLKILEQVLKCERIQSIVFLMKYDYQELFNQLKQLFEQLLNEENVKAIKGNQKLLQQFLALLS